MERKQSRTFRVRNFGNDREYDTVDQLVEGLREHYLGQSVAVHVKGGQFGMVRPFFVDVRRDGRITETYSDVPDKIVDTEQFRIAAKKDRNSPAFA
jgi:hypothetical protein